MTLRAFARAWGIKQANEQFFSVLRDCGGVWLWDWCGCLEVRMWYVGTGH